jgi:hypothetical protein
MTTSTMQHPSETVNPSEWDSQFPQGYWEKYNVIDNRTGEMVKGRTFTFLLDSDPHAEVAMLAYARAIQNENPTLATDIWEMFPGDVGRQLT